MTPLITPMSPFRRPYGVIFATNMPEQPGENLLSPVRLCGTIGKTRKNGGSRDVYVKSGAELDAAGRDAGTRDGGGLSAFL